MNHHAYIALGTIDDVRKHVDGQGVKRTGNPDVWEYECETFTIDDARELKKRQQAKSVLGGKKIVLAACSFITTEAQNSLLKVFEEPTQDTHIFLTIPSVTVVLPTLLSRVEVLEFSQSDSQAAEDFLKASVADRQKMIKDIVENKDKKEALALLSQIERALSKDVAGNKDALKSILKLKQYLYGRSPSVKSIMEYIASFV